jgi:tRNA threonylcarbamoyladenosine biosynthesis protein TsaB
MKILAIECTHQVAYVAVHNGSKVFEGVNGDWQKTAEAVVPLVMQVMADAGAVPSELDGVAVSAGPGSFTALRIGMSVAKGIAYGAGCPLLPVSTLLAMAVSACGQTGARFIVPVIPSRPGECFYAVYSRQEAGSCVFTEVEDGRCMVVELAARLEPFDGDVAITVRDVAGLVSHAPELAAFCIEATRFSAATLLSMAEAELAKGPSVDLRDASPDYRQIFVPLQKKQ